MISWFDIVLIAGLGWAGYRLWSGTTSLAARAVALSSLLFLVWVVVAP